jgi:hypothetical protein
MKTSEFQATVVIRKFRERNWRVPGNCSYQKVEREKLGSGGAAL